MSITLNASGQLSWWGFSRPLSPTSILNRLFHSQWFYFQWKKWTNDTENAQNAYWEQKDDQLGILWGTMGTHPVSLYPKRKRETQRIVLQSAKTHDAESDKGKWEIWKKIKSDKQDHHNISYHFSVWRPHSRIEKAAAICAPLISLPWRSLETAL